MSEGDPSLRARLVDPGYWQPRLRRLAQVPRRLVIVPREDLSRPGVDVLELRLQAHDETAVRALLGRSAYARRGELVRLRPAGDDPEALDWSALDQGSTDVVVSFASDRRLEDRVLDVLRVAEAVSSLESVDQGHLRLGNGRPAECEDAFVLAGLLRERGWS